MADYNLGFILAEHTEIYFVDFSLFYSSVYSRKAEGNQLSDYIHIASVLCAVPLAIRQNQVGVLINMLIFWNDSGEIYEVNPAFLKYSQSKTLTFRPSDLISEMNEAAEGNNS